MTGDELTAPHWDAAARGELLLPRCEDCGRHHWRPEVLCPHCASPTWSWTTSEGRGLLYSASVVERSPDPKLATPYVLCVVHLDEGVDLFTHLVDAAPSEVRLDARVHITFRPLREDDRPAPVAVLAGGAPPAPLPDRDALDTEPSP